MFPASERRFLEINFFAVVSLFVVILAGGIVRSTGSGMGCPDWPKCFGRVVPPVSVSQLPLGYQQKFVLQRVKKNEKFAKILDMLGFGTLAFEVKNDKSILKAEEFNVAKTWTEYINRIAGVIAGFLMIGTVIFSVTYLKSAKRIFVLSFFNLLLVGFQGWLGSIVVSTNLLAWTITIHMILAFAIVAISIYTYFYARSLRNREMLSQKFSWPVKLLAGFALILTMIQVVLGTGVREQIDAIAETMNYFDRSSWVAKLGAVFSVHRDLAIVVVVVNAFLFFLIRNTYPNTGYQIRFSGYCLILLIIQVLSGIVLSYLGIPAIAQTLHVFIASLLFGAQYFLWLVLGRYRLYK